MLYLSFEDERLVGFTYEDFNAILECHIEMTGKDDPILFLMRKRPLKTNMELSRLCLVGNG